MKIRSKVKESKLLISLHKKVTYLKAWLVTMPASFNLKFKFSSAFSKELFYLVGVRYVGVEFGVLEVFKNCFRKNISVNWTPKLKKSICHINFISKSYIRREQVLFDETILSVVQEPSTLFMHTLYSPQYSVPWTMSPSMRRRMQ